MNENEQRMEMAEALGWRWYRRPGSGPWTKKPMRSLYHPELIKVWGLQLQLADMTERECNPEFIWREGSVPNYSHDLNAIHEAINSLNYNHRLLWLCHVNTITERDAIGGPDWLPTRIVNATAAQRVEAFLRTIGKWKEST